MIDFQNGGLEHQVYELISKMCDLGCSDIFPHFATKKFDTSKWECTLSIPEVKSKAIAYGKTEAESINACAMNMIFILKENHDKDQFDPDIDNSIFAGNIEQFFVDVDYNHEYKYHLCETDILFNSPKFLKIYAGETIRHIYDEDEAVDRVSEIVTIRLLVKKKKRNYC